MEWPLKNKLGDCFVSIRVGSAPLELVLWVHRLAGLGSARTRESIAMAIDRLNLTRAWTRLYNKTTYEKRNYAQSLFTQSRRVGNAGGATGNT